MSRDRIGSRGRRRWSGMTGLDTCIGPAPAAASCSSPTERPTASTCLETVNSRSSWQQSSYCQTAVCERERPRRATSCLVLDNLLVSRHVLAAYAHRKRRRANTMQTVNRTCLLGVFPRAVGATNVEPPVPEDVDPSFGSIPRTRYRGTGRRRAEGTFRARAKS
mgnify:CR=1 FL=1